MPSCIQPVPNSQLSGVTAASVCASEAAQPMCTSSFGGSSTAELPCVAGTAAANALLQGQPHALGQDVASAKACALLQCLLDPTAVLAALGFKVHKKEDKQVCTAQHTARLADQIPAAAAGPDAELLKVSTAIGAAANPQAPPPEAACSDGAVRLERQDLPARSGSLLTLLGLHGTAAARSGAAEQGHMISCAAGEEEAKLQAGRLAGIAVHVIEVLLEASLTQPEVRLVSLLSLEHLQDM